MNRPLIQVATTFELEILQPGIDSQVLTNCSSIRIRNTSQKLSLLIAPKNSVYQLPIAPGGLWGIDNTDVHDELRTVLNVGTKDHDSPVIIERLFKHAL